MLAPIVLIGLVAIALAGRNILGPIADAFLAVAVVWFGWSLLQIAVVAA